MFSRVDFDVVGFSSARLNESSGSDQKMKTNSDASSQTELLGEETSIQIPERVHFEVQSEGDLRDLNTDYDVDKLASFLSRVCPSILETLDTISESEAYLPARAAGKEFGNTLKVVGTIESDAIPEIPAVEVSCLVWNSSANMLILGYKSPDHEDWCTHSSSVQFFSINMSDFNGHTPTCTIPTSSCVTSLASHPFEPSVVAVGTVGGEIYVFDLQRGQFDADIGNAVFHKDCVTKVSWVHINNQLLLVTSSVDSYMFFYKYTRSISSLILTERYTMTNDIEHLSPGITTFAFYPQSSNVFIVAMESGELIHCSTSGAPTIASTSAKNPVLRSIGKRKALIIDLDFCPKVEDIFIASFTDDKIVTYSLKEASPLQEVFVHFNIRGVICSTLHRGIIFSWGRSSKLFVYEYNEKKKQLSLHSELQVESMAMKFLKHASFPVVGSKVAVTEDKRVMLLDIPYSKI